MEVLSKITEKLKRNLNDLIKLIEIQKNPGSATDLTPVLPVVEEIKNDINDLIVQHGRGLRPDLQKKLFSLFKRFHPDVEGSGIGLYMIKRMLENHEGRIEVESREEQGTTFRLYFKAG